MGVWENEYVLQEAVKQKWKYDGYKDIRDDIFCTGVDILMFNKKDKILRVAEVKNLSMSGSPLSCIGQIFGYIREVEATIKKGYTKMNIGKIEPYIILPKHHSKIFEVLEYMNERFNYNVDTMKVKLLIFSKNHNIKYKKYEKILLKDMGLDNMHLYPSPYYYNKEEEIWKKKPNQRKTL